MGWKIENQDKIILKIEGMGKIDFTPAIERTCLATENDAKRLCPKDTGALRNSIQHRVSNNEGVVYTNMEYAPYVEYGTGIYSPEGRTDVPWVYMSADGEFHTTSGMQAQPFMDPAFNMNRDTFIQECQKYLNEVARNVRLQTDNTNNAVGDITDIL